MWIEPAGLRINDMNTSKNTLEKIPSFEELEIIYFDLDRRLRRGEKLPLYRMTVILQDKNQFTGVIVEPKVKDDSQQVVLRLDTDMREIVIFHRYQISSFILKDIQESGHYFFETWKPEGPSPSPLEVKTLAKETEQLFIKVFGKTKPVKLPDLPALQSSQLGILNQNIIDVYWVLSDMCQTDFVKEELGSRINTVEFKTQEQSDAPIKFSFHKGILTMESCWVRCFSCTQARAFLWKEIEALF
jgi:hypothetical protein